MRKIRLLILPLISVSFACSSPEADGPMSEITFEGVSSQRIAPTTTETIDEFRVTAYYEQGHGFTTLLDGVTVKRTGPNKWSYSPSVDWPDATVNFLAVSPTYHKISVNYWWLNVIQDFVCTGREDLLIATRYNAVQGEGNIRLNFRHTLAQVNVKLHTDYDDARVMVHKVYIKDIQAQGNYYLPQETTEPLDPDGTSPVQGEWNTFNKSSVKYTLFSASRDTLLSSEPMLTNKDCRFFLPGELDPLQFSGYYHGSRIEVLYQVYDPNTGELLWPNAETPFHDTDRDEPEYAIARYSLLDGLDGNSWHQGWSYNYSAELLPGNSIINQAPAMKVMSRQY